MKSQASRIMAIVSHYGMIAIKALDGVRYERCFNRADRGWNYWLFRRVGDGHNPNIMHERMSAIGISLGSL